MLLCTAFIAAAGAQDLSNDAFRIRYDDSGIRSLERTKDVHDTDYIAPNGALGPLLIRYRTTANGDWRELRNMLPTKPAQRQAVRYTMGTLMPALAARSAPSAHVGAGGLRALNDGEVPAVSAPGRRGAGAGRGPAAGGQVPLFTWSGARGETQWVQYTFPAEEEVSWVELFWVATAGAPNAMSPPRSWRLLYQDGGEWKEVSARDPYGTRPTRSRQCASSRSGHSPCASRSPWRPMQPSAWPSGASAHRRSSLPRAIWW